jgi:trimeric autotransporter adhesin
LRLIATNIYDSADQQLATIDPLLNRTSTIYDGAGRPAASINPLGKRATTIYDAAGRTIARIDPLGNRTLSGIARAWWRQTVRRR